MTRNRCAQVGNPRKALNFYMIAAHLSPKDITLWHRLATLSTELGFVRQAIYCLGKARTGRSQIRPPSCRACRKLVCVKQFCGAVHVLESWRNTPSFG